MSETLAKCQDESYSKSLEVITLRAFEKWNARGQPSGSGLADWLEAEMEIRQFQTLTDIVERLEQCCAEQLAAMKRAQQCLMAEHNVARILSLSATLNEAAPSILQSVCWCLNYDVGVLWNADQPAAVLHCMEVFELEKGDICAFRDITRESRLAMGEGLPGRVWACQSVLSVSRVAEDTSSPRSAAAAVAGLQSTIAFPVRNGIDFLAVMEFFSRTMREENEVIVEMMACIGSQISQFIERRRSEVGRRAELEQRRLAGRIQQGLLPQQMPVLAGYDVSGRCQSALDVGGDCFDFISMPVDGDNCLGTLVADASGHGIGAALFAAETRAYVRALAMTCPDVSRLLTLVNQRIADDPEREGFVTAVLLRVEPGNGAIVYANAGHCPPIVFDIHGEIRGKLNSTGFPLGIDPASANAAEIATLQPGELILMFSDGAIEARSPGGELFGIQRLLVSVRSHWRESADEILAAVFHDIVGFYEGRDLQDDITVVVIQRQQLTHEH